MSGYGRQFCRENFADSPKTTKFVKVFSLESFPLYGSLFSRCMEIISSSMKLYINP